MVAVRLPSTPNPAIGDDSVGPSQARRGRPILFQVTDPTNQPIFQYLLALHQNPETLGEKFSKSRVSVQSYGGYIEWIWPDELDTVSCSGSTGAFLGPDTGLTSGSDGSGALIDGQSSRAGVIGRHGTMAWERQEDLFDLFRNNGMIYNGQGIPVLHGQVMMIYDRGIYTGYFTSFQRHEGDEQNFSFELSWDFKIIATLYKFPGSINSSNSAGFTFLDQSTLSTQSIGNVRSPTVSIPLIPGNK